MLNAINARCQTKTVVAVAVSLSRLSRYSAVASEHSGTPTHNSRSCQRAAHRLRASYGFAPVTVCCSAHADKITLYRQRRTRAFERGSDSASPHRPTARRSAKGDSCQFAKRLSGCQPISPVVRRSAHFRKHQKHNARWPNGLALAAHGAYETTSTKREREKITELELGAFHLPRKKRDATENGM